MVIQMKIGTEVSDHELDVNRVGKRKGTQLKKGGRERGRSSKGEQ